MLLLLGPALRPERCDPGFWYLGIQVLVWGVKGDHIRLTVINLISYC